MNHCPSPEEQVSKARRLEGLQSAILRLPQPLLAPDIEVGSMVHDMVDREPLRRLKAFYPEKNKER